MTDLSTGYYDSFTFNRRSSSSSSSGSSEQRVPHEPYVYKHERVFSEDQLHANRIKIDAPDYVIDHPVYNELRGLLKQAYGNYLMQNWDEYERICSELSEDELEWLSKTL
jgi:hypothetical protein